MAGDDFDGLTDYERAYLGILLTRLRESRSRGLFWRKFIPLVQDARGNWLKDDDINLPTFLAVAQEEAERIDLAGRAAPSEDDTSERMEKAKPGRVDRHRKEDGTDEIPSLGDEIHSNSDSTCPQKPKKNWACMKDIKRLIREAGERLTREQVLDELQSAGKEHSESSVTKALCYMVNESHELTNGSDEYGRGYGLAEWE